MVKKTWKKAAPACPKMRAASGSSGDFYADDWGKKTRIVGIFRKVAISDIGN